MNRRREREASSGRAGFLAIAAAAVLLFVALGLYQLGGGPGGTPAPSVAAVLRTFRPTAVPPDAEPTEVADPSPESTIDPATVADCTLTQLAVVAGGWGGATGSVAGGASLINVSSEPCGVRGKPAIQLRDKGGSVIAKGRGAQSGDVVVLVPGGITSVPVVWSNWCGAAPARPLSIRLSLFRVSGSLTSRVLDWNQSSAVGGSEFSSLPRCDAEDAASEVGVPKPFDAAAPAEPAEADPPCAAADLLAFLGSWGAAAGTAYVPVVVFNQSGFGCVLDGSPPLELRDAKGQLLAHGNPWPAAGSVDLAAGSTALTYLGFADWCLPPPRLPFGFELRIADDPLAISPTSRFSAIGIPACQSDPPAQAPKLFYNGPFALPGS